MMISWQENIAQFGLPASSVKSSCSSKPLSLQNDGDHRADPVWLTVCPSRFCHTGSWSGYQEMLELIPADTTEREPKNGRQPGQSPVCHPVSNWWDREWAWKKYWHLARILKQHLMQKWTFWLHGGNTGSNSPWTRTTKCKLSHRGVNLAPNPPWSILTGYNCDHSHGGTSPTGSWEGFTFFFTVFLHLNSSKVHVNEWLLTQTWPQWRASFPDAATI